MEGHSRFVTKIESLACTRHRTCHLMRPSADGEMGVIIHVTSRWGHRGPGRTARAAHGRDPGSTLPHWTPSPPRCRSESGKRRHNPLTSQVPADTWEREELGGGGRQLSAPLCVGLTPASSFRSHPVMEGPGGEPRLPGLRSLLAG